MQVIDITNIITSFTILILLIIIASVIIGNYILKIENSKRRMSYEDVIAVMNISINTELSKFDKNIFVNKKAIRNDEYIRYYNDLSKNIINSLPDTFIEQASYYMTKQSLYTHITDVVKSYLQTKIPNIG